MIARFRTSCRVAVGLLGIGCAWVELSADATAGRPPASPASQPSRPARATGEVRNVRSGESIVAAVDASAPGDTVLVHAGHYPRLTLTRQFSAPVSIVGASGEKVTIDGFTVSGGAGYRIAGLETSGGSSVSGGHDVVFDRISCALPAGNVDDHTSCFYLTLEEAVQVPGDVAQALVAGILSQVPTSTLVPATTNQEPVNTAAAGELAPLSVDADARVNVSAGPVDTDVTGRSRAIAQ